MGDNMRVSVLLFLTLCIGCAVKSTLDEGGSSIEKPPFPRTKSILPLAIGNSWVFSYTEYDSLGKMINPNRMDLHLSIPGGYGLKNDMSLVQVTYQNASDNFSAYVYKFEWEGEKKGYLVVYRDLYPLSKRGVYIIGEYDESDIRLFPSEQLWLAYPADSGKTWRYNLDSSGDSGTTSSMKLVSTKSRFFFPNINSMTGLSFCDCYVYKDSVGNSVYYYYYNETIGQLGYLEYVNNKLRVTYLLKSYYVGN